MTTRVNFLKMWKSKVLQHWHADTHRETKAETPHNGEKTPRRQALPDSTSLNHREECLTYPQAPPFRSYFSSPREISLRDQNVLQEEGRRRTQSSWREATDGQKRKEMSPQDSARENNDGDRRRESERVSVEEGGMKTEHEQEREQRSQREEEEAKDLSCPISASRVIESRLSGCHSAAGSPSRRSQ